MVQLPESYGRQIPEAERHPINWKRLKSSPNRKKDTGRAIVFVQMRIPSRQRIRPEKAGYGLTVVPSRLLIQKFNGLASFGIPKHAESTLHPHILCPANHVTVAKPSIVPFAVEAARIAVVNPATLAVVIKNSSALPARVRESKK